MTFKDTYGRDIQVGDNIAYAPYAAEVRWNNVVMRGTVLGFTPKRVRVELERTPSAYGMQSTLPPTFMDTVMPGRIMVIS